MFEEITTTIVTKIDLETMTPSHSVHVDAEDTALPKSAVVAAVSGGLKAALKALGDAEEDS